MFCKVRLGDVVYPRKGSVGIQGWRNRVDRKHLDFVIVTADALRPVAAVELDDASHGGSRAAERDAVKDRVLAAAGLPLVRIRARAAYGVEEVRMDLARAIAPAKK